MGDSKSESGLWDDGWQCDLSEGGSCTVKERENLSGGDQE